MIIGIVGLGLIGGSLAAAFRKSGHVVYGYDAKKTIQDFAKMAGSIDAPLEDISACDYIFIAIPPRAAISWMKTHTKDQRKADQNKTPMQTFINPKTIVIDCCGTKRGVCHEGFALAKIGGYKFMGGHPMAGKQFGGYKNSSAHLFDGAMFALVPDGEAGDKSDIRLIMKTQALLKEAGFKDFAVMSPEDHDKVIAFTSQMAHLISNAYIKSDMAEISVGTHLSGGAFRDMTRVAYLDESMWTELFMENKDNLLSELEGFIGELERYKTAIETESEEMLTELLREGKKRKEEINRRNAEDKKADKESIDECQECQLIK